MSAGPSDLRRTKWRYKIPRPHGRGYFLAALRASEQGAGDSRYPDVTAGAISWRPPGPYETASFRPSEPLPEYGSVLPWRDAALDAAGQALDAKEAFGVSLVVGAAAFHGG